MDWDNVLVKLDKDERQDLSGYLKSLVEQRPVYIYGAGSFGRELHGVFLQHGYVVEGFVDRNADQCAQSGIPVAYPEELQNRAKILLVIGIVMSLKERVQLEEKLHQMGYKHIVDGQSIRAHYVYALSEEGENEPRKYFKKLLPDIKKVEKLFSDNESRKTYEQNLSAHLLRDYTHCFQTNQEKQYFVDDIPFSKKFSRFVDCGAYIGDTLQMLCKVAETVDAVAAFEANLENFTRLSQVFDMELNRHIHRAIFFPCGVYNQTKRLPFRKAGGSSAVSFDNGEEIIQCVALDDVLKGFSSTFIKMDIEGAEYEALKGAEQIIKKDCPDLAISVYHIIDDFWRIPILIHGWNLGYQFYLRTHSSCCMETILYAVCAEKGEANVRIDKTCGII